MMKYILLLFLVSCNTGPDKPKCITEYEYCRIMNFDGAKTCGIKTLVDCMNYNSVWGFSCIELETETCK